MAQTFIKPGGLFIAFFLLIFFGGCHNFYKASGVNNDSGITQSIDSLKLQSRYFILRSGNDAYYMRELRLSADHKTLECTLDTLPADHRLHLENGRRGKMQYRKSDPLERSVLNEVHLFIPQDNTATLGKYSLSLDKVQKMEVLQKDKKRTTNSYVIGAVGYTLGAAVVVGIIVAATKSSCPFVSAYDGDQFSLQGEIYGGAIYPQLARLDFMPLKMSPIADGSLQLKISNELMERQYTDLAELWVVTHDKNIKVLADEKGNLYSVSRPQAPVSAWLNDNKDVSASLLKPGDNALLYMDDTTMADARNEVVMRFKRKETSKKGKLVLTLKNSYWLDLLYGELAKGFGRYYTAYTKKQRSKPVAELLKWTSDQQIPLEISVKTSAGWEKVTALTTIGPLATREMVVPVDVSGSEGSFADIKLSGGFMFWEIDYAAMDFSSDESFTLQKLAPAEATDELGKDVLTLLQKEDGRYLEQPSIGNIVTLAYKGSLPADSGKTQAYILKSKGYYEHVRDFKNKPDIAFLKQFTRPDAFPVYGMALYKRFREENIKALAHAR